MGKCPMRKSLLVIAMLLTSGLDGANVPWIYRGHQSPDCKYRLAASGKVKLYDRHDRETGYR